MEFIRKISLTALAVMSSLFLFVSCEEELTTLGDGVVAGDPFSTGQAEYDVFANNKRVLAVQTNRLPLYQLGFFDDPIYGRSEAKITSQLRLSTVNPSFGNYSQSTEDGAETDDSDDTINEEETVTEVTLYIPYQLASIEFRDKDNDGVPVSTDVDDNDSESDSDNDGVTDAGETAIGSDPLNPDETGAEEDFVANQFPQTFPLDSIFTNDISKPFALQVAESTFFLNDLNPDSNFEEAQQYFSDRDLASQFVGQTLASSDTTQIIIDNQEFFELTEDDEDTEDVNEFNIDRQNPGIRIKLDPSFFQENLLDKEGSFELLSQANFTNLIRGIHLSLTPLEEDFLILLDLSQASITVNYTFKDVPSSSDTDDEDSTTVTEVESQYVLNLIQFSGTAVLGNAVNTILNPNFPDFIDSGDTSNAERLYLKGGPGSYAELLLFGEDGDSTIDEIRANNWIINEANLELYIDRETLDGQMASYEPPRLYLYNAETNAPVYNAITETNTADTSLGAFLNYDGILAKEDGKGVKYTLRITEYLNDIIVRDSTNVPLRLAVSSDVRVTAAQESMVQGTLEHPDVPVMSTVNPFGTILFGGNVSPANEDKKLKLRLFYTEAN